MNAPRLLEGDCLRLLPTLAADSFHSCVTDPPYHLTTGKQGGSGPASANKRTPQGRASIGTGFMGKAWDGGDTAFRPDVWREVLRVLKPGGYLLAFGGTRTYHRMTCAIEDAGFEIRDCIRSEQGQEAWPGWVYGSGMPKSRNMARAMDQEGGTPGQVVPMGAPVARMIPGANQNATGAWAKDDGRLYQPGQYLPGSDAAAEWQGWGTGLKPAWEPIVVARKPFRGTVAANVQRHGTGALNIDACRVGAGDARPLRLIAKRMTGEGRAITSYSEFDGSRAAGETAQGRWPANVIHDGSDQVEAAFAAAGPCGAASPASGPTLRHGNTSVARGDYNGLPDGREPPFHGDKGSPSRFFYSSKAGKADRAGSDHPCVKPVTLLRFLSRLVTAPGGRVLDPFAGSGTTGAACLLEGFEATLIEADPGYAAHLRRRFGAEAVALPSVAA